LGEPLGFQTDSPSLRDIFDYVVSIQKIGNSNLIKYNIVTVLALIGKGPNAFIPTAIAGQRAFLTELCLGNRCLTREQTLDNRCARCKGRIPHRYSFRTGTSSHELSPSTRTATRSTDPRPFTFHDMDCTGKSAFLAGETKNYQEKLPHLRPAQARATSEQAWQKPQLDLCAVNLAV